MSAPQVVEAPSDTSDKVISRALGEELRRAREALGWSRGHLVARLPSGIGERTLLSYEHGTRHLTALRFVELCRALGAAATRNSATTSPGFCLIRQVQVMASGAGWLVSAPRRPTTW